MPGAFLVYFHELVCRYDFGYNTYWIFVCIRMLAKIGNRAGRDNHFAEGEA